MRVWSLVGLVCALGTARAAAEPVVVLHVAPRVPAWQKTTVKVTVRNATSKPIVPVAITLESQAGTLAAWGIEGTCSGTVRGCWVQSRWASSAAARRRGSYYELLLGRVIQQRVTAPDDREREATERMIALAPISPGATVELERTLVATYEHGGKLAVKLTYLSVDPQELSLCAPTAIPPSPAFVPCKPTNATTGVYIPAPQVARAKAALGARAEFTVERPAFDIEAARAKAKLATGPFGYEPAARRWILVDDTRQRTAIVGANGTVEELPGDWLNTILDLAGSDGSIFWSSGSRAEATQIAAALRSAGIVADTFVYKGGQDPTRLRVRFRRDQVSVLAKTIQRFGHRMTAQGIIK
jgi:hypothetical protein